MRVFGNKALRGIFGGSDKVIQKIAHRADLLSVFFTKRIVKSRMMRLVGHIARMGEMSNAYNILFGKPLMLKKGIKEISCEGVDCIHLVQDRVMWRVFINTVIHFRLP